MNANATSRPISQQSANSWIPLLAAVLVAIALVIGVAGVAALTAKSSATSSTFVLESINSHEHAGLTTLPGVPYPGGLAGPSQVSLPGVPFPGGLAGPSQLDRFAAPGMGGH